MSYLMSTYKNEVVSSLKEKLSLGNVMEVPVLKKIVLNSGLSSQQENSKFTDEVFADMTLISGQKPVVTKSKKSIAGFKLREGMQVGVKVTLRNRIMYDFFARLIHVVLPRIKDFSGLSLKSFDQGGNYSFGVREHIIFPEVSLDKAFKIYGFDVTLVIQSRSIEHSVALLREFDFPLRKK